MADSECLSYMYGRPPDAFEASAMAKGLSLRPLGPPNEAQVLGDPTRIKRVLANLLSNAIKFTSE